MQKKFIFTVSGVKSMVEDHAVERTTRPLKDHLYFS